jgi:hypothetical protein
MRQFLWLDDVRDPRDDMWKRVALLDPPYEVIWVKNYNEFTSWIIDNGLPEAISFDHDLCDGHYAPEEFWDDKYNDWLSAQNLEEKTGNDCAKWLVEYCLSNDVKLPIWGVHSANPVGATNIRNTLKDYYKLVSNG